MIIVFTMFFDIQTSLVLGVLLGFVILPIKAFHFHKHIDWRFTRLFVVLGLPCGYIGGLLMFDIPIRGLEIILSILCFLFIVSRLSPWKFSIRDTTSNLVILGAIAGFQSGITGVGNLFRNPMLLALGLSKERYIGTGAMIAFFVSFGKIIAYIPNVQWTTDLKMLLLITIPPVFIGMYIGKKMHTYISKALFEKLVLLVIFIGAVKLLLFP